MTQNTDRLAAQPPQYAAVESALESGVVSRRGETVMVSGEGCWMIDSEGNRYLDLTASQGVAMLGYGHPRWLGRLPNRPNGCTPAPASSTTTRERSF